jgi:hypothetical protein
VIRVLAAGVDSVYWSARADVSHFGELLEAKTVAASLGERAMPWASVDGFTLSVLPHGGHGFPVVLQCDEFTAYLTDSRRRPTGWVQVRSAWLHEVGPEAAVIQSARVVGAILRAELSVPHPSRIDLYVDVAGWVLVQDDLRGVVTHAKLQTHSRAGTREIETLQVGKSPTLLRLYRKDIEVARKGGHAPLFWGDWHGPVLRIEMQLSGRRLADFGFTSCFDLLRSTGDLWRYVTHEFVNLREPGAGPRESWRLREEWRLVQSTGVARFSTSGLVPFRVVKHRKETVVAAVLGYLASYAAFEGIEDARRAVHRLLEEFPDLVMPGKARTFATEVVRRRALLPKAVRRLSRGLLPAGKDEDDRRSHLNNSITTDEVGGHA